MKHKLTVRDFVKLKPFSNKEYPYKIHFLGCAYTITSDDYEFCDLFFYSHGQFYLIYISRNDEKIQIEFNIADSIWDLRLFNVMYDTKNNELCNIKFLIPKEETLLKEIDIFECLSEFTFTSNLFDIYFIGKFVKDVNISFDEEDLDEIDSFSFIENYFPDFEDLKVLQYRIQENDKYTKSSLKK